MSQSASSTPAIALCDTPPRFWRVARSMSQYSRWTSRGSSPTSRPSKSRTQPVTPKGLRVSLHSPQPTSPPSVSTLTKIHGRQPASQTNDCARVIRMHWLLYSGQAGSSREKGAQVGHVDHHAVGQDCRRRIGIGDAAGQRGHGQPADVAVNIEDGAAAHAGQARVLDDVTVVNPLALDHLRGV